MRVSPPTKVGTFKSRFREEFGVDIKCHKGMSKGHIADDGDKLHEICTNKEVDRDFELDIHGNMKVSTVEEEVAQSIGIRVQLLNPDGSNASNSMTLGDLRDAYEGGSEPAPAASPSTPVAKAENAAKKGCLIGLLIGPFV